MENEYKDVHGLYVELSLVLDELSKATLDHVHIRLELSWLSFHFSCGLKVLIGRNSLLKSWNGVGREIGLKGGHQR